MKTGWVFLLRQWSFCRINQRVSRKKCSGERMHNIHKQGLWVLGKAQRFWIVNISNRYKHLVIRKRGQLGFRERWELPKHLASLSGQNETQSVYCVKQVIWKTRIWLFQLHKWSLYNSGDLPGKQQHKRWQMDRIWSVSLNSQNAH